MEAGKTLPGADESQRNSVHTRKILEQIEQKFREKILP